MNVIEQHELSALTAKFGALLAERGEDSLYASPDYAHVRDAFGDHPDFDRWRTLHAASVDESFRTWKSY